MCHATPKPSRLGFALSLLWLLLCAAPARAQVTTATQPCTALAVAGPVAYLGEGNHLTVLDVTASSRPVVLRRLTLPAAANAIALGESGLMALALESGELRLYDCSRPAIPQARGHYQLPAGETLTGLAVAGQRAYLACQGETTYTLRILSLANPTSPTLLGTFAYPAREPVSEDEPTLVSVGNGGVAVAGTTAYLGQLRAVVAIDVSDPAHPLARAKASLLGNYGGASARVCVAGQRLYAFSVESGDMVNPIESLAVFDISQPGTLAPLGVYRRRAGPQHHLPELRALAVEDKLACLGDEAGLRVLDLTNPRQPVAIATQPLPEGAELSGVGAVALRGGRLYLAPRRGGLKILELGELAPPKVLASVPSPRTPSGWPAPVGNHLDQVEIAGESIVARDDYGLRLFSTRTWTGQTTLTLCGSYYMPSTGIMLAASANPTYPVLAASPMPLGPQGLMAGVAGPAHLRLISINDYSPFSGSFFEIGITSFSTTRTPLALAMNERATFCLSSAPNGTSCSLQSLRGWSYYYFYRPFTGAWSQPYRLTRLALAGDLAAVSYFDDRSSPTIHQGVHLLDVADPDHPALLSSLPAPPAFSLNLAGFDMMTDGRVLALSQGSLLRLADLNNPAAPVLRGEWTVPWPLQAGEVRGDIRCVALGGEQAVVAVASNQRLRLAMLGLGDLDHPHLAQDLTLDRASLPADSDVTWHEGQAAVVSNVSLGKVGGTTVYDSRLDLCELGRRQLRELGAYAYPGPPASNAATHWALYED